MMSALPACLSVCALYISSAVLTLPDRGYRNSSRSAPKHTGRRGGLVVDPECYY